MNTSEQNKGFTLVEYHTTIAEDGSIYLPPQLLSMLGVGPGKRLGFLIQRGTVMVRGEKQEDPGLSSAFNPTNINQASLFAEPKENHGKQKRTGGEFQKTHRKRG